MEGLPQKGTYLCQKWYIKGKTVRPLNGAFPYKTGVVPQGLKQPRFDRTGPSIGCDENGER